MSAEEDARARRDAWLAAGAPDYGAPTYDESGNISGYQSVADQPAEQRSASNQHLPSEMAWLRAGAPDYGAPIRDASGIVTGYRSVAETTPAAERSASIRNLESLLASLLGPVKAGASPVLSALSAPDAAAVPRVAGVFGSVPNAQYPAARDGQTIANQPMSVQETFYQVYGAQAPTKWAEEHNKAIGATTVPVATTTPRTNTPGVVPVSVNRATTTQPLQDQSSGFFQQLMEQLTRRAGTSSISTGSSASGMTRLDRAMAAIWEMDPGAKQLYQNDRSIAEGDWKGAVQKYLAGKDPVQYAVDQGWIAKPPPRTVEEAVDARTLEILQSQGLLSPDLLNKVNSRLQANYELDAQGQPIPEVDPEGVEGSRFLPPIPSVQMWNQLFNQAEREGTGQLFQSLGLDPSLLMGEITRFAPPGGGSGAATVGYRRRVA